jgi:hypothetical protein
MDQILHIFRKDVRQHWYEIVLSLTILAAFAANEPSQWMPQDLFSTFPHQALSQLLAALTLIAWIFLIIRVVHGESLVGDRQFWITRPYEWTKLLAAKVLFFFAFINVPLLIVQLALLRKAGHTPGSYLKGLLWMQLLWVLFLILPTTTLATITSGFGQSVLVLLAIPLVLIGLGTLSFVGAIHALTLTESDGSWAEFLFLPGTCLAVVTWQYLRRRTLQSRLLLIGAPVAMLIIFYAVPQRPYSSRKYPDTPVGQQPPVQLAFDSGTKVSNQPGPRGTDKVWISIPLLVAGIAPNSVVGVDAIAVSIQTPDGMSWNSGWVGNASILFPAQPHSDAMFAVDKTLFEQVKSNSATINISFALAAFKSTEVDRIVAADREFAAPGGLACWAVPEIGNILQCRSPMRGPLLEVTALSSETTCSSDANLKWLLPGTISPGVENVASLPTDTVFAGLNWNRDAAPAELGISPVKVLNLFLNQTPRKPRVNVSAAIVCPGTPLTFSTLAEVQHTRTELTIYGVRLADYRLNDSWGQR